MILQIQVNSSSLPQNKTVILLTELMWGTSSVFSDVQRKSPHLHPKGVLTLVDLSMQDLHVKVLSSEVRSEVCISIFLLSQRPRPNFCTIILLDRLCSRCGLPFLFQYPFSPVFAFVRKGEVSCFFLTKPLNVIPDIKTPLNPHLKCSFCLMLNQHRKVRG